MSYDEKLAMRVRRVVADPDDVVEKKMFGGLCFMVNGAMCCGLTKSDFMVRVGPESFDDAVAQPHARPMDFTGRPSTIARSGALNASSWSRGIRIPLGDRPPGTPVGRHQKFDGSGVFEGAFLPVRYRCENAILMSGWSASTKKRGETESPSLQPVERDPAPVVRLAPWSRPTSQRHRQ